jgi:8-oxo-dGTP pyrophosphatase MutT (NUDIX family)
VIRRDRDGRRILMGRRSDAHVFMPGAVVFPGGKVDRADRLQLRSMTFTRQWPQSCAACRRERRAAAGHRFGSDS